MKSAVALASGEQHKNCEQEKSAGGEKRKPVISR
jgi:hypothetical protein